MQGVEMKRASWGVEPDSVGRQGRGKGVARPVQEEVRKRRTSKIWGTSHVGGIGRRNREREGREEEG